jgi:hypothetical protein
VLKEFLVQQISASEGKVFVLFHPESPVKVEKLLELIKRQKERFRLSPDGRLSFAPRDQEWHAMVSELIELLYSLFEQTPPPEVVGLEPLAAVSRSAS